MSTKHNTKHYRKPSNYPNKNKGKQIRMKSLYELRKRSGATLNGQLISNAEIREVRDLAN